MRNGSATVVTGSQANGTGLMIRDEDVSKIQMMFIETYSSPVTPIREIVINGIEASEGKSKTVIDISYNDTSLLGSNNGKNNAIVTITDSGSGMSREFVESFFVSVGASTKDNDDDGVGGFGIGAKSVMSISKNVVWSTVKDGENTVLIMTNTGDNIETNIESRPTDEPNGTTVTIPIDGSLVSRILNRIDSEFLDYQSPDVVAFTVNGVERTVGSRTNSKINSLNPGEATVSTTNYYSYGSVSNVVVLGQGNVPYQYTLRGFQQRRTHRGIESKPMFNPVVRLNLTRKNITPNRESLIQSDALEEKIIAAIDSTFIEQADEYADRLEGAETFREWMAEADTYGDMIHSNFTPRHVFGNQSMCGENTFEEFMSRKIITGWLHDDTKEFGSNRSVYYRAFKSQPDSWENLGVALCVNSESPNFNIPERFITSDMPKLSVRPSEADGMSPEELIELRKDKLNEFMEWVSELVGIPYEPIESVRARILEKGKEIRKSGKVPTEPKKRNKVPGIKMWVDGVEYEDLPVKKAVELLPDTRNAGSHIFSVSRYCRDELNDAFLNKIKENNFNVAIILDEHGAVSRVKAGLTRAGRYDDITGTYGTGIIYSRITKQASPMIVNKALSMAKEAVMPDGRSVLDFITENNSSFTTEYADMLSDMSSVFDEDPNGYHYPDSIEAIAVTTIINQWAPASDRMMLIQAHDIIKRNCWSGAAEGTVEYINKIFSLCDTIKKALA